MTVAVSPPPAADLSPESAAYVQAVVDAAPPLSEDQRSRLAELLRPARHGTP